MADAFDPRTTAARPDIAATHLRGVVEAAAYAEPRWTRVAAPLAPVTGRPEPDAPLASQLLYGERFAVYDLQRGWAWGQGEADGYVGWVPDACLAADAGPPGWRLTALTALVYPAPKVKARPEGALPFGARVDAGPAAGGFRELAGGGFVPEPHLAPAASAESDWVAVAERFLGAPYLWGGRSPAGIDCSGLVQVARQAAGLACLRDSDMQQAAPGRDAASLRRGDLIFWRGHVGIMVSPTRLLHANAFHMAVAVEPLQTAVSRIEAAGGGAPTARRRWAAAPRP